jgi:methyl-accepting chemotaxis protein
VKEPLFWLGFSIVLVAISLTMVLMTAIPAFQELSRAARSAEKLFDTLNKEFPSTLEAIRLTNSEITELSDEVKEGIKSASGAVKEIDKGITTTKKQVQKVKVTGKSVIIGFKAAWNSWREDKTKI